MRSPAALSLEVSWYFKATLVAMGLAVIVLAAAVLRVQTFPAMMWVRINEPHTIQILHDKADRNRVIGWLEGIRANWHCGDSFRANQPISEFKTIDCRDYAVRSIQVMFWPGLVSRSRCSFAADVISADFDKAGSLISWRLDPALPHCS